MPSVLITGANRGLGLEFARQYAGAGWRVFATCRTPAKADALSEVARASRGRVSVHELDVRDRQQARALAAVLSREALDVLLNNAAVWGSERQRFGHVDEQVWTDVLSVDLMGPLRITEAFIEHVAASERRIVVVVSSRLASIECNDLGERYMYRSAKAGANAIVKSLAIDLASRRVICIALNPGWVRTAMGGANAPLSAEESVAGMRRVIDGLKAGDTGRFLAYDGSSLPW